MRASAEAASLLYRMAGLPDVAFEPQFSDVPADAWFGDAVNWAHANGIVQGIGDGRFMPDAWITRQEMALILYRYAASMGRDMTIHGGAALEFPDANDISDWAFYAMTWAVHNGLVRGNDTGALNPFGTANRAEAVVLMQRFVNMTQ